MSEEKAINLLWNCAQELSTQTHTERILKSYYTNTCRKLARHHFQFPDDYVGAARMCVRCGNQWTNGNYQLKLQCQRLANNAKRRRQIAQLEAEQAKRQRGNLSTGARKRAKWLKKRMASNMTVNCALCGHNTILPLEKPKKRYKTASAETIEITTTTTTLPNLKQQKKKKKNKQNKDIASGLKILPAQQQKTPTAIKAAPKAATKAAPTSGTATATSQSHKQKQKTKAAQSASKSAVSSAPKVQSKTQKQNALLQLAAQLKAHASKTAQKTPQNRLQALLK